MILNIVQTTLAALIGIALGVGMVFGYSGMVFAMNGTLPNIAYWLGSSFMLIILCMTVGIFNWMRTNQWAGSNDAYIMISLHVVTVVSFAMMDYSTLS